MRRDTVRLIASKKAAHFAVAPFLHNHGVPVVEPRAALVLHGLELRRAVLEVDPGREAQQILGFDFTDRANGVLALHFVARVHQTVGKRTGSRKDEKAPRY